jgi:hypothetical protein
MTFQLSRSKSVNEGTLVSYQISSEKSKSVPRLETVSIEEDLM